MPGDSLEFAVEQPTKITVAWALRGLELALNCLVDGPAERRVRDQFHQLLLALERDGYIIPAETAADAVTFTPSELPR